MARPVSPYLVPGFYDVALANGRHRDIVGGRWDETGRVQMALLRDAGLQPHHHLLDIGAGSLRLGCKAVDYLESGHYWATDASRALMLRGREVELSDPARLPEHHLVEDATFSLPGVPECIDFAIAFGVFTHLPLTVLESALVQMYPRLPRLRQLLFTVFLSPTPDAGELRQPDGVVTHADRPPYHFGRERVADLSATAGWAVTVSDRQLPRGQVLFCATRNRSAGANHS